MPKEGKRKMLLLLKFIFMSSSSFWQRSVENMVMRWENGVLGFKVGVISKLLVEIKYLPHCKHVDSYTIRCNSYLLNYSMEQSPS